MNKIAFITGASSGIGWATAKELDDKGYNLILCGRRIDKLNELEDQLTNKCVSLVFDVRSREEVFFMVNKLPEEWKQIDVLVNNAGNAHGLASFQDGSLDDFDAMMDINVKGLYNVSKAVLPLLKKGSTIINIGSIAGREVYPNGNAYCASKHAVHALSEAMRIDLLEKGINVTNIAPGLVETEFSEVRFKGDKERAKTVYEGYSPLQAKDIAETISFVVSRPKHVNIADIMILPSDQASSTIVKKELN